jgi:hypothetical protein
MVKTAPGQQLLIISSFDSVYNFAQGKDRFDRLLRPGHFFVTNHLSASRLVRFSSLRHHRGE